MVALDSGDQVHGPRRMKKQWSKERDLSMESGTSGWKEDFDSEVEVRDGRQEGDLGVTGSGIPSPAHSKPTWQVLG